MVSKEKVYAYLENLSLDFKVSEHPAIFTIDALEAFDIPNKELVAKNLFLRNDNGKKHYLLVVRQDKVVDLKLLRNRIGSSRLSFASEERLMKHLGLKKGSVTPLGVINDVEGKVAVYFDSDLVGQEVIGVHPNDNTATVWMSYDHIQKLIEHNGNHFGVVQV